VKHDWDEIAAYYNAGHSMRACKARFGFSRYAWERAVAGGLIVPRVNPRPSLPQDTRLEVARLLASGRSQARVAFELGISQPTVSYHARKLGILADERASRRYRWDEIQQAHDAGLSMRELQAKFGFSSAAWYAATADGRLVARAQAMSNEEFFVADSRRKRDGVKRRLIRTGLKEERCEHCGLSEWRGKPLRVALHHVNGDGYDHRIENLELLCPNCHSQTANYGGRNGHMRPRRDLNDDASRLESPAA
jgi:hypothetical protein